MESQHVCIKYVAYMCRHASKCKKMQSKSTDTAHLPSSLVYTKGAKVKKKERKEKKTHFNQIHPFEAF